MLATGRRIGREDWAPSRSPIDQLEKIDCIVDSMEWRTTTADASEMGGSSLACRWISRGWRVIATGIGFALAGISCITLVATVFPLLRWTSQSRERAEVRTQYTLHLACRLFMGLLTVVGILRIRCYGAEKLRVPGALVISNHPTLIDALILMSVMPQAYCVVKANYFDSFWLNGICLGAGYIPNRSGPQVVEECVDHLRAGRSLMIFPEGTRSPKDGLGPFSRGAAHIAWRAQLDPVPVTIQCSPATLYGGQAWWNVPDRRFGVTITVGDPMPLGEIVSQPTSQPRAARAVNAALRDHFERRLAIVRDQSTS